MISRVDVGKRMSRVVIHNGTAYLSGLTGDDYSQNATEQTKQLLAKAERMLSRAGTNKSRLLSAIIWLRELSDFDAMNTVWEGWIDPDNPPARATSESRLAHPDARIEIVFVAAC